MAYSQGGVITATDYNGLANTTVGSNVAWVWGVGYGAVGYGQSTAGITTLSSATTVSATQWTGLFNTINRSLGHQGGTQLMGGGNLNAVAGSIITYLSNVSTAVTTINTNYASAYAQGSTTTGADFDEAISSSGGINGAVAYGERTVTFASAAAARYFFNAGGQLNYYVSSPTAGGSGSQQSLLRLITGLGGWGQKNTSATGRFGSGLTLNTNNTTTGYRNNLFNSATRAVEVTDTTAAYTSDVGKLDVYTSSSDTTTGANGLNVKFYCLFSVGDKTWDDTISITLRTRVDIVYPETTYLTSTWGTPTVS